MARPVVLPKRDDQSGNAGDALASRRIGVNSMGSSCRLERGRGAGDRVSRGAASHNGNSVNQKGLHTAYRPVAAVGQSGVTSARYRRFTHTISLS
jgi:hypothetical protein